MLHGNEISKEDEHGKYFSKRKKAGPVDPALVLERTMFDSFQLFFLFGYQESTS
jgi:hypothetical protein